MWECPCLSDAVSEGPRPVPPRPSPESSCSPRSAGLCPSAASSARGRPPHEAVGAPDVWATGSCAVCVPPGRGGERSAVGGPAAACVPRKEGEGAEGYQQQGRTPRHRPEERGGSGWRSRLPPHRRRCPGGSRPALGRRVTRGAARRGASRDGAALRCARGVQARCVVGRDRLAEVCGPLGWREAALCIAADLGRASVVGVRESSSQVQRGSSGSHRCI